MIHEIQSLIEMCGENGNADSDCAMAQPYRSLTDEFADWDALSDEALRNFESRLPSASEAL